MIQYSVLIDLAERALGCALFFCRLVVGIHRFKDIRELFDFMRREYSFSLILHVVIWTDDLFNLNQVHRVAIGKQSSPWLPFFSPTEHLAKVAKHHNRGPIYPSRNQRSKYRPEVMFRSHV